MKTGFVMIIRSAHKSVFCVNSVPGTGHAKLHRGNKPLKLRAVMPRKHIVRSFGTPHLSLSGSPGNPGCLFSKWRLRDPGSYLVAKQAPGPLRVLHLILCTWLAKEKKEGIERRFG